MFGVNLQTPGQGSGAAKEFLIKPVAPSADCLGKWQCRCNCRECVGHIKTPTFGNPQTSEHTDYDAAPDAEAALPNLERIDQPSIESFPVSNHVIQPRPNYTCGNCRHCNSARIIFGAPAALLESAPQ